MSQPLHPTDSDSTRVCVFCGHIGIRVFDSRSATEGCKRRLMFPALGVPITRRRKECESCNKRWSTIEVPLVLLENPQGQLTQSMTEYLYTVLRTNRSKLRAIIGTQKTD